MNLEYVKNRIKVHEGFRNTVYTCPAGKLTIGYGHMLVEGDEYVEGVEYDKAELDELFNKDFKIALDDANSIISDQELEIPDLAKEVLIEMCFNIGKPRTLKFKKMLAAMKEGKFQRAANELINSRYYTQVTKRVEQLALILRGLKDK
jgi:lysozyme